MIGERLGAGDESFGVINASFTPPDLDCKAAFDARVWSTFAFLSGVTCRPGVLGCVALSCERLTGGAPVAPQRRTPARSLAGANMAGFRRRQHFPTGKVADGDRRWRMAHLDTSGEKLA